MNYIYFLRDYFSLIRERFFLKKVKLGLVAFMAMSLVACGNDASPEAPGAGAGPAP